MTQKEKDKQHQINTDIENLIIRRILAGWDCLENMLVKPTIYNLKKTPYWKDIIPMVQVYSLIKGETERNLVDYFYNIAYKLVTEKGCKTAYYWYISVTENNNKYIVKGMSFEELEEKGREEYEKSEAKIVKKQGISKYFKWWI